MTSRQTQLPFGIGRIAGDRLLADGYGFTIGGGCLRDLPFRLSQLPDLVHRLRAAKQPLAAQRCRGHRIAVRRRFTTDVFEQLETAGLLELAAEVAEHEADQAFRLRATTIGICQRRRSAGRPICSAIRSR